MGMPENDTRSIGVDFEDIATAVSAQTSRRRVLRGAGGLLSGGALTAMSDAGRAAQPGGDELNVRTTDVDILDPEPGEIRAKGRVGGMSNYDCERCEIGAFVRPLGDDQWYGGLQTVHHTHRDSFWVGVTLVGLRPGRYHCRLCACPVTLDTVFTANILAVVIDDDHEREKKEKHHHKK